MKILVVEDEEDLRDLIGFTLESQLMAEVSYAASGNQAIRLLEGTPNIDCVVSDYAMPDGNGEDLYRWLLQHRAKTPFVLVSAYAADSYPIFREHPIAGAILKPHIFKPLVEAIRKLGLENATPQRGTGYCAIRTRVILKYGLLAQDLYVKLSEGKYVKVFRKGDVFDVTDFERYKAKTVEYLYLRSQDANAFVTAIGDNVAKALEAETLPDDAFEIASSAVDIIREVGTRLGFTPEVQKLAKANARLALRCITTQLEKTGARPLDFVLPDSQSFLGARSMSVAHVACGLAGMLGWTSGTTLLKLSFAALLQDVTLVNPEMARLRGLDELAIRRHDFTKSDVENYMDHAESAAALAKELKDVPPDIDVIIREHHEKPDGSGLYRRDANSINPLSAVFVMAQEIVDYYLEYGPHAELATFVNRLGEAYGKGNFKPVLKAITNSLVNTSAPPAAAA